MGPPPRSLKEWKKGARGPTAPLSLPPPRSTRTGRRGPSGPQAPDTLPLLCHAASPPPGPARAPRGAPALTQRQADPRGESPGRRRRRQKQQRQRQRQQRRGPGRQRARTAPSAHRGARGSAVTASSALGLRWLGSTRWRRLRPPRSGPEVVRWVPASRPAGVGWCHVGVGPARAGGEGGARGGEGQGAPPRPLPPSREPEGRAWTHPPRRPPHSWAFAPTSQTLPPPIAPLRRPEDPLCARLWEGTWGLLALRQSRVEPWSSPFITPTPTTSGQCSWHPLIRPQMNSAEPASMLELVASESIHLRSWLGIPTGPTLSLGTCRVVHA